MQIQKDWMPIDLYFGGAEHTTMHLLYSRFWQKALYDLKLAVHQEPYTRRINRGLILGPDGNKMSKSKGNVIDPDEQVEKVGSDTVKMYLAFMGPYGEAANYPWDMGGIAGIRRFLERVYGLSEHVGEGTQATTKLLHKTIKKVSEDIEALKFNTAISAMMVFVNHVEKSSITQTEYETFLRILAPFAPHLTEELWSEAGNTVSIHVAEFPVYDESLVKDDEVTIGVQINGKMRGEVTLAPDAGEDEALKVVKNTQQLQSRIENTTITKVIYVPGRILNLIISE
jgi:leucyl-tRNA synthetase